MTDCDVGTLIMAIGPLQPKEFLQQIADSDGPGSLYARLCLENPNMEIGQRLDIDLND